MESSTLEAVSVGIGVLVSLGFSTYSAVVATKERTRAHEREMASDQRDLELDEWMRQQDAQRAAEACELRRSLEDALGRIAEIQAPDPNPPADLAIKLRPGKVLTAEIKNFGAGSADISDLTPTSQSVSGSRWGEQSPPLVIRPGDTIQIPLAILHASPFVVEVTYTDSTGEHHQVITATS